MPGKGPRIQRLPSYPDKEIFEIIDPATGEVKDDAQDGEIVYTSLDSRASVVLRYRTGILLSGITMVFVLIANA